MTISPLGATTTTYTTTPSTPTRPQRGQAAATPRTPVRLPVTPQKTYDVVRATRTVRGRKTPSAAVLFTPNAKKRQRNGVIYSWHLHFQNGSVKTYSGETIQPLSRRSSQHIRQAATTQNQADLFHQHLNDYASNPNSDIIKITVSLREAPGLDIDLRKLEELYIQVEDTLISVSSGRGLNRIHASAELAQRYAQNAFRIITEPRTTTPLMPAGRDYVVKPNKRARTTSQTPSLASSVSSTSSMLSSTASASSMLTLSSPLPTPMVP